MDPDGASDRPWSGDAEARRLYAAVRRGCGGGGDMPARLAAGLGTALEMLAREPELAWTVTVRPFLDDEEGATEGLCGWIGLFAELLREAAAADPRVVAGSPLVAPFLVGGVRFQIARLVLRDEAGELPRLLPRLLETLLAYYFEPGEPLRRARAEAAPV